MAAPEDSPAFLPAEAVLHYQTINEAERLSRSAGLLELVRTREIIQRYLPAAPATVFDVGGAAGVYAFWLAELGYQVHLIDAMPRHIQQARHIQQERPDPKLAAIEVGDARKLALPDHSAEVVLLLGPLYHLTERSDRLAALREAYRVLKPGGVIFAAAVSRYASAFDGLFRNLLTDPQFVEIVWQDLENGQHRNPANNPGYFTTTFFHRPDELAGETEEAGFKPKAVLGVEGPAWLLPNFAEHWNDPNRQEVLLEIVRKMEQTPELLGLSAHLLAVGRKVV